jgi:competence protein ComEC
VVPRLAPIVVAATAALLGALAVHQLPQLPSAAWWPVGVLAAVLALRRREWRPLLWFLAAALWTTFLAHERLEERLPLAALGRDFAVSGTVATFPDSAVRQITFGFAVDESRPAGVPARLRLTWYDPPTGVQAGARFALTVRLRPPLGARNPGGFDYEQWLLVNGYGATGYVRQAAGAPPTSRLRDAWLGFRAALAERLRAAAPDEDGAALVAALALGERYLFTDRHWADFRRTGTSHLVAVSGMHVALLGLVVFAAVRRCWLRLPPWLAHHDLEAAAVASLAATAYYAALTGFAVPAQRSLVMIAVGLAVLVSRRRIDTAQALAATLVAVLAFDPFAPLTASFWLSFVAVALLLALARSRPLREMGAARVRRAYRAMRELAAWQWWIGLALLPLTVLYFGELSAIGSLVNLVAIPFFNAVLVPLVVAATMAQTFAATAAAAAPLVTFVGGLGSATVSTLHFAAELPGAAVIVPMPPLAAWVVAVSGVAFAAAAPPVPGRALAWLALVPLVRPSLERLPHDAVRAVVLDVGHGLAVIVETRAHRLLFDAGPASAGFDSGTAVVLPALASAGRRGLDAVVVSHADNDHAGGAAAVLAAYPGATVWKGPDVERLEGRTCARGTTWRWDGVVFEVLHPESGFAGDGNDSSCVLRVSAGGRALLLTGDVERRGEAALLGGAPAADVVVVPHHGSATSSSEPFVAAVGARYAIVSAGFANRWGFPRPDVRARWQASGATLVETGVAGAVTVELAGGEARVFAERDGRHRYWETPRFSW